MKADKEQLTLGKIYRDNPCNYILLGKGGYGKTTQLKYAQRLLIGKTICINDTERICIPIYYDLSDINRKWNTMDSEYLYRGLMKYFGNSVTDVKQIKRLLQNEAYQFIFLLDGVNEIVRDKKYGDRAYSCLINNIDEILKEFSSNIHFIMSTREEYALFDDEELEEQFVKLRLEDLPTNQIRIYLDEQKEQEGEDAINALLANPMLLSMYKEIRKQNPGFVTAQKYELIKEYVKLDRDLKASNRYYDGYDRIRKTVIDEILPHIAYRIEKCLVAYEDINKLDLQELILEIADEEELEDILNILQAINLVDNNLKFSHQMIREYFAAEKMSGISIREETEEFFRMLTETYRYKNKQDFERRTMYLDLGEFIYAMYKDRLEQGTLIDISYAQDFLQELAGVYDDLKERKLSGDISRRAYRLLQDIECESLLEKATRYNFLGYCILNASGDFQESMELFSKAKEIAENMDIPTEYKKIETYHKLRGATLNNYGAYYYRKGEYDKAEQWHRESLKYRKNYDKKNVMGSFRAIMSDCYKQGKYLDAYQVYLDGLKYINENAKGSDLADFMERAIGSEIELFFDPECTPMLRQELESAMIKQIETVYSNAIGIGKKNQRIYKDGLNSLRKKLDQIAEKSVSYKCQNELVRYAGEVAKRIDSILR